MTTYREYGQLIELETTYQHQDVNIFLNCAVWLKGIPVAHGVKTRHPTDSFRVIANLPGLEEGLPAEEMNACRHYMNAAIERLEQGFGSIAFQDVLMEGE